MAFWKPSFGDLVKSSLHRLDSRFNALRGTIKQRGGWLAPPKIMPYRGFGNQEQFHLLGRVLEQRKIGSPKEDAPWWDNLLAMYRRFAIYSFAGVRVQAEFQGQSLIATTDDEGRFTFHWPPQPGLDPNQLWHEVRLTLLDQLTVGEELVTATASVMTPAANSQFGVISDIDDTIIHTNATDVMQMIRIACMHNARTRTPLPGVAEFYRALEHRGVEGAPPNPFFYVSSSAWNLYDLLVDFLDLHELPRGPLMLRNMGTDPSHPVKSGHKLDRIREIMRAYPHLPFLLIGDAGQDDPQLYRQAVEDFPGRVKAIYIRSVTNRIHDTKVHRIREDIERMGSEIVLVENTYAAVAHAVAAGFIQPEAVTDQLKELQQMDLAVR